MRCVFTLLPTKWSDPKLEKDNIEYLVEEVKGVDRVSFDLTTMKLDVEYDDEDTDFDKADIIRVIHINGKFQVVYFS